MMFGAESGWRLIRWGVFSLVCCTASGIWAQDLEGGTSTISGFVTDAQTGQGIEGAILIADAQGGDNTKKGVRGVTDASGHYILEGLASGHYSLNCLEPVGYKSHHYDKRRLEVAISGSAFIEDFVLTKGMSVAGIVTDTAGMPLEGVRVRGWSSNTMTNENGEFYQKGLAYGKFDFSFNLDGYITSHARDVSSGAGSVKVKMYRAAILKGIVTDSETDSPIEEFGLQIYGARTNQIYEDGMEISEHPDARFEESSDYLDQESALYVRAPGYLDVRYPLGKLVEGAVVDDIEIRMSKARGISGRVEDVYGKPVSGALILKQPISEFSPYHAKQALAVSDENGAFVANGLDSGDNDIVLVAAHHPPKIFSVSSDVNTTILLVLDQGEVIDGYVTLDGVPVEGAFISGHISAHGGAVQESTSHDLEGVKSDANGYYRFDSTPTGYGTIKLRIGDESPSAHTARRSVHFHAGNSPNVNFALSTATASVEGYILMSDGRPKKGNIYITPNSGRLMYQETADDGHYLFKNVPVGAATLTARVGNSSRSQSNKTTFEVFANQENLQDHILDGSTNINIRVNNAPIGKSLSAALLEEDKAQLDFGDRKVLDGINSRNVDWSPIDKELTVLHAIPDGSYVLVFVARGQRADPKDFQVLLYDILVQGEPEIDVLAEF